jgi:hypothetical protein
MAEKFLNRIRAHSKEGYCFPQEYIRLFQLSIKYREKLDKFSQEAILFAKS